MIRLMTIDDYDEVFDLWINTKGIGLRSLDDSIEGIAHFLERNPNTSYVSEVDNKIVGVILSGNDGRRGYIYHMVVGEKYRKQGIATELIDAAVKALKAEGITRVCLNVLESNEQGKQFWNKQGWNKLDTLGFYSKGITDKENTFLIKPF